MLLLLAFRVLTRRLFPPNRQSIAMYSSVQLLIRQINSKPNRMISMATSDLVAKSRLFSTAANENKSVDSATFEKACDETLDSLCEYFEELVESSNHLVAADVVYGDGVLTVNFGKPFGTYVINRQSPNRQIWLSSPTSGPKRYDFDKGRNCWIYKHDGISLHRLLQEEVRPIVKKEVDFAKCSWAVI